MHDVAELLFWKDVRFDGTIMARAGCRLIWVASVYGLQVYGRPPVNEMSSQKKKKTAFYVLEMVTFSKFSNGRHTSCMFSPCPHLFLVYQYEELLCVYSVGSFPSNKSHLPRSGKTNPP